MSRKTSLCWKAACNVAKPFDSNANTAASKGWAIKAKACAAVAEGTDAFVAEALAAATSERSRSPIAGIANSCALGLAMLIPTPITQYRCCVCEFAPWGWFVLGVGVEGTAVSIRMPANLRQVLEAVLGNVSNICWLVSC